MSQDYNYIYNYNLTYSNNIEYQYQFLKLFNLDKYDNHIINFILDKLYKKVIDLSVFKIIIRNNAKSMLSEDLELGFRIMFSYDNLKETHKMLNNLDKN